ncbi:adenylyl-sulfate kinase [Paenibacillus agilis]|uniref:Adenylyl-sulfate kinase n=1 Tax=Paenibacillus agilis TaxID=3020863 RepID=A0A559J0Y8_9BACL|nr:adenylyl-sulfate kinase [Paenibacillus agilis]
MSVYWITGLSGAGKSTVAAALYERLKCIESVVLLDGDSLREVFGDDIGYTYVDRKKSAMRNSRLCKLISDQNISVICATISMFDVVRAWNRENILDYCEIYLNTPMELLYRRDQKKLYSRALLGQITNVLGVDMPFEEPKKPDVVILNDGVLTPEAIVEQIIANRVLYERN